jgi:phage baseplate assembly protein W
MAAKISGPAAKRPELIDHPVKTAASAMVGLTARRALEIIEPRQCQVSISKSNIPQHSKTTEDRDFKFECALLFEVNEGL